MLSPIPKIQPSICPLSSMQQLLCADIKKVAGAYASRPEQKNVESRARRRKELSPRETIEMPTQTRLHANTAMMRRRRGINNDKRGRMLQVSLDAKGIKRPVSSSSSEVIKARIITMQGTQHHSTHPRQHFQFASNWQLPPFFAFSRRNLFRDGNKITTAHS